MVTGVCEAVEELWTERHSGAEQRHPRLPLRGARDPRRGRCPERAEAARHRGRPALRPALRRRAAPRLPPHTGRRIVLATNVAETSLTVPGIRYVIDTGTARISRYSQRTKVQRLPIEPVSQASANQRPAAAAASPTASHPPLLRGRLRQPARVHRPEILRTNLASVILQMTTLGLGDIARFPFLDPPDSRQITDGVRLLEELRPSRPRTTPSPREGAATSGTQAHGIRPHDRGPADRPPARPDGHRGGPARRARARCSSSWPPSRSRTRASARRTSRSWPTPPHKRFADETSDFPSWLTLWPTSRSSSERSARAPSGGCARRSSSTTCACASGRTCTRSCAGRQAGRPRRVAGSVRTGEARSTPTPSTRPCSPASSRTSGSATSSAGVPRCAGRALRHQPRVRALPQAAAVRHGRGARRDDAGCGRGSTARIDPVWAEELGAHLVKRQYSEPRWSGRRGSAVATERVTLYGVPLVVGRTVGRAGRPRAGPRPLHPARPRRGRLAHRARLPPRQRRPPRAARRARGAHPAPRPRRRRQRADRLLRQADSRDVVSGRHFDTWWKKARRQTPDLLTFTEELLLRDARAHSGSEDHPTTWRQGDLELDVTYQFDAGLRVRRRHRPHPRRPAQPGDRRRLRLAGARASGRNSSPRYPLAAQGDPPPLSCPRPTTRGPCCPSSTRRTGRSPPRWRGRSVAGPVSRRARRRRLGPGPRPPAGDLQRRRSPTGEPVATGKDLEAVRDSATPQLRRQVRARAPGLERTGLTRWDVERVPETFEGSSGGCAGLPGSRRHGCRGRPAGPADPGGGGGRAPARRPAAAAARHHPAVEADPRAADQCPEARPRPQPARAVSRPCSTTASHAPIDAIVRRARDPRRRGRRTPTSTAYGRGLRVGAVGRAHAHDRPRGPGRRPRRADPRLADLALTNRLAELDRSTTPGDPAAARRRPGPAARARPAGLRRRRGLPRLPRPRPLPPRGVRTDSTRPRPTWLGTPRPSSRSTSSRARYADLLESLRPRQRGAAEVVDIGWMIEELRVSLFAQTLGTAYSVSPQRVLKAIAKAQRPDDHRITDRVTASAQADRSRTWDGAEVERVAMGESWGDARVGPDERHHERPPVQDPTELFQFETDADLSSEHVHASVLVVALGGFIDAGHTQRLLAEHLLETARVPRHRLVRRRPAARLPRPPAAHGLRPRPLGATTTRACCSTASSTATGGPSCSSRPRARLPVGPHGRGRPELDPALGVDAHRSVHGIPMAVPHTRPLGFTAHGTNPRLIGDDDAPSAPCRCPASFSSPCSSCASARPATTQSASPCTCRTTSARAEFADAALLGLSAIIAATGLDLDTTTSLPRRRPQPRRDRPPDGGSPTRSRAVVRRSSSSTTRSSRAGVARACSPPTSPTCPRPTRSAPSSRPSSRTSPTTTARPGRRLSLARCHRDAFSGHTARWPARRDGTDGQDSPKG